MLHRKEVILALTWADVTAQGKLSIASLIWQDKYRIALRQISSVVCIVIGSAAVVLQSTVGF